jgi:hypothetical protein
VTRQENASTGFNDLPGWLDSKLETAETSVWQALDSLHDQIDQGAHSTLDAKRTATIADLAVRLDEIGMLLGELRADAARLLAPGRSSFT